MQNQEIQGYNKPLKNDLEKLSAQELEPSPNNPPWNSITAFFVWLASVALIVIFPGIAVALYIATNGIKFTDKGQLAELLKNDVNLSIVQLIAVVPAHIFTLVLCWLVVTKFNKFSFKQTLGWKFNNFKMWHAALIIILIFTLAGILTTTFGETDNELLRILRSSRTAVLLVAFMATFTAPIVEEVVYRGVLYSALQKTFREPKSFLFENNFWFRYIEPFLQKYPVAIAVLVVTFLFAGVHVPQYAGDFVSISMICLLSLVLTLVRVWTNNLLPCIVLHFVFNGIQSVFLVLEPYISKNAQ
ncbi:MAG: CPBP family intramembrane glutamic endopeptidase [Pyrinomonadaceae bacterium]